MRFRAIHKVASYLMVVAALGALSFGGNLEGPVLALTLLGVVISALVPESRAQGPLWQTAWTVATFVALGLCVVEFLLQNELVIATVNFLLFLLVNKLFNRRSGRDYLQLYVITFMMVIAGSVLNVGISFALWFVVYIVATTWSLILFHLRREMEENYLIKHSTDQRSERVAVDRILNSRRIVGGWFLAGTSLVSVTVFLLAIGVFLFFPRIGTRASSPQGGPPRYLTGFSDRLSLGGYGRLRDNPQVVMRVYLRNVPEGVSLAGLHYRGAAFDRYANGRWYRSPDAPRPRVLRAGRYLAMGWDPLPGVPAETLRSLRREIPRVTRQEVYQEGLGTDVLFAAGQPLAVDLREKTGLRRPRFRVSYGGELRADLGQQGGRYVILTDLRRPSRARLAAAPALPVPEGIRTHYLAPKDATPARVRALGERLAKGRPTTLAKVEAVLAHLRKGFGYSRVLRRSGSMDPIAHFLFQTRAGHCEYFASAMVLLLRAGGVPARVVTGFLGGAWNRYGEYVVVRQGDAHAWVEVWFSGIGWVTFDPTPAAGLEPLAAGGWLDRLEMMLDSIRMRWQRWVIDYDVNEQMDLFNHLRLGLRSLKARVEALLGGGSRGAALVTAAALGGLLLLVLWARRRARRREESEAPSRGSGLRGAGLKLARRMARLASELARLGLVRLPGETLMELAVRLDAALPEAAPGAAALVADYYRLRYAGPEPAAAEVAALEQRAAALVALARAHRALLSERLRAPAESPLSPG